MLAWWLCLRLSSLFSVDALHRRGKLVLQGDWRELDCAHGWQDFLDSLRTIDWVVFSRGVWDRREEAGQRGEVARAVEYLARYAHRVAMSNSRLVAIQGEEVLFRYRDHRAGGVWRTTSLTRRGVPRAVPRARASQGLAEDPAVRLVGQCRADRKADAAAQA